MYSHDPLWLVYVGTSVGGAIKFTVFKVSVYDVKLILATSCDPFKTSMTLPFATNPTV
jgi:hypothetical protein